MEFLKKIVHILSIIIYILITIYAIICIPNVFGYKPLIVLTGSMEPTFKTGSLIYYKKVSQNELNVGDIITFTGEDGKYISHRIQEIRNNQYITKGDANESNDASKVNYEKIMGKDLNISIPYLGYYIKLVNEKSYLVVIVIIVLILEFLLSNRNFDINKNREKERTVNEK